MRRTAIVILLCLLAGVVIQVGLAWVAAWRTPEVLPVLASARPVVIDNNNRREPIGSWMATGIAWSWHTTIWINDIVLDPKLGVTFSSDSFANSMCKERFGVPLRGLQVAYPVGLSANGKSPGSVWAKGLDLSKRFLPSGVSSKQLPVRPVWPAFALNTLFYAVVAWVAGRGVVALRYHLRRHAVRCTRCNYSLAGLAPTTPCPECGTPQQQQQS